MNSLNENFCASHWALLPSMLQALRQAWVRSGGEDNFVPEASAFRSMAPSFAPPALLSGLASGGQVAVLPIRGLILPYSSALARVIGATCLDALSQEFCKARDNPDIRAIILDIDSPGGMVTGVHAFSQQVFAARHVKPIVSLVSGLGASAAYWIASAASRLVLDPTASVGSIGVVTTYQDFSEKQKKEGVQKIEIVSSQSPHKRLDLLSEEGRGQVQAHVDSLADVFVNAVATYRNVPAATVLSDFGQGGLVVGAAAVNHNMADGLATLPDVLSNCLSTHTRGVSFMGNAIIQQHAEQTSPLPPEGNENAAMSNETLTYEQGFQAGLSQGKTQERARIQAIDAQSLLGHEALIAALKVDGMSTASDAAFQILAAEKAQRTQMAQALQLDAPPPLAPLLENEYGLQALPFPAQCEAEWAQSASVRAEFHSFEAYVAYRKAEDQGYVKQFSTKEKAVC